MLDDIFSMDELVDNLRIIHKVKSTKENYDLIMISNAEGETVMMPSSKRTLYDLYILINKNLKRAFNKELDKDLTKYRKFMELKSHDKYIDNLVHKISTKDDKKKSKFKKFKESIKNAFLSDKAIRDEFNDYKIKYLMMSLIDEEEGLMDNYYISKYLNEYHDIDVDFHQILIDSINSYTEEVSVYDDSHYPKVEDYGTAQDYFYKIRNRSGADDYISDIDDSYIVYGRLYYRKILNDDLLGFIKKSYKSKREVVDFLCVLFWIIFVITLRIVHGINSGIFVIVSIILICLLTYTVTIRKIRMIKELKEIFSHENEVLSGLTNEEHKSIFKWVLRDIKDGQ